MNQSLLSEKPEHMSFLCEQLGLGIPAGVPERVLGGFHHKMWRLKTDRGLYAVKQLGPDTDATDPGTVDHYNVTESIAEAFAHRDISAIHALRRKADYLQIVAGAGYLVYPWTDAVAIDSKNLSGPHALKIAALMAKMHRADIQVSGLKDTPLASHAEDKILLLVDRAIACHARDYQHLEEHLPGLLAIASRQEEARHILARHRVICHGDLDQKNVLWSATGEPILIDWESARRLNATHETVLVALEWSGITSAFEFALFEKFIAAYQEAGGVINPDLLPAAFDRISGNWLDWLMFNVGRTIDLADPEQRAVGAAQVDLALATLLRLEKFSTRLVSRVREYLLQAC
ncbi:MAG: phosphotransferase [Halioglobus sp.]